MKKEREENRGKKKRERARENERGLVLEGTTRLPPQASPHLEEEEDEEEEDEKIG